MRQAILLLAVAGTLSAQSQALDLNGRAVDVPGSAASGVAALVFVGTDCPILNCYAPEIQRIYDRFEHLGVSFRLLYSNGDDSAQAIRRYRAECGYSIAASRDRQHALAGLAKVRITPEASVLCPGPRLLCQGSTGDRDLDFGKARQSPISHDFETLEAVPAGRMPPAADIRAVGHSME